MPKYDFNNPDDDLAFCIDYALGQQKLPPKKNKHETREQVEMRRSWIAKQIVQHIKRSNWKFEKGPVAPGHSTSWRRGKGDE